MPLSRCPGEHLLSTESPISGGDVTLDPVSPLSPPSFTLNESVPDFNLEFNLDEALKLVGLNSSETGEAVWKVGSWAFCFLSFSSRFSLSRLDFS